MLQLVIRCLQSLRQLHEGRRKRVSLSSVGVAAPVRSIGLRERFSDSSYWSLKFTENELTRRDSLFELENIDFLLYGAALPSLHPLLLRGQPG